MSDTDLNSTDKSSRGMFTRMAVADMQGANQRIRSSLTCRPGELHQRPSDNKTLALPVSYRGGLPTFLYYSFFPFSHFEDWGYRRIRLELF